MDKISLEQLEEMQEELFRQQCDLDIQKAMVKHFIKKEKAKQLTLTDVVKSDSELLKVLEYTRQVKNNPKEIQLLVDKLYIENL